MNNKAKRTDEDTSPGQGDPFRQLMAAVLAQAAMDARAGDLAAAEWILTDDCQDFAEIIGIDWQRMRTLASQWAAQPRGRLVVRVYEEGACLL